MSNTEQQKSEPLGFSMYIYVVRGAGGLCLTLPFLCVFYSFKSISVKLLLSPVSFVDRSGSREGVGGAGGLMAERGTEVERRRGSSNVRKLED